MTQLSQPADMERVMRRGPKQTIYRVTRPDQLTSFSSKRVLGMWVPAEAFRRGTIIRAFGASSTASTIIRLSIGGPGTGVAQGVNSQQTGPAAATQFDLRLTQVTEAFNSTNHVWTGIFAGATSLSVSSGNQLSNIQPLNFVEMSTVGTFSLAGCGLEVIPPQWNARLNGEIFDT